MSKTLYRSIFISDVHLGINGNQVEPLLHFLKHNKSQYVYLVGDIIDISKLRRWWYWTDKYNVLLRKFIKISGKSKMYYVPGNHDEFFRQFCGTNFGGIEIINEITHITADQKKMLVIHGDQFDTAVRIGWISLVGSIGYEVLFFCNNLLSKLRWKIGFKKHWSLSAYIKTKVKNAVKYLTRFEDALISHAKTMECDGVICGHLHYPNIRKIDDNFLYCNCGDFVESMSVLVEHLDGRFELLYFKDILPISTNEEDDEPIPSGLQV